MNNNISGTAVKEFSRIDVLLNNAGVMPLAPLERLKTDEWDQMIDVNFKGVLNGIAAALRYMKEQQSGHFINVSSVYGHKLGPDATVWEGERTSLFRDLVLSGFVPAGVLVPWWGGHSVR